MTTGADKSELMTLSGVDAELSRELQANLEERGLGGLYHKGHTRHYRKGQILFLEGDPLEAYYILLKGAVRVIKQTADGKSVTLSVWPAVGTLGDMNLVDGRGAGASVEAITDCEVLVIDRKVFIAHLKERPELFNTIMRNIVERLRHLQDHLLQIVSMPVEQRLVQIILSLSRQFGPEVPLSHQDIADLAGVCRELVSKKLHQLQDTGALSVKRGRLVILDERKLRELGTATAGQSDR